MRASISWGTHLSGAHIWTFIWGTCWSTCRFWSSLGYLFESPPAVICWGHWFRWNLLGAFVEGILGDAVEGTCCRHLTVVGEGGGVFSIHNLTIVLLLFCRLAMCKFVVFFANDDEVCNTHIL